MDSEVGPLLSRAQSLGDNLDQQGRRHRIDEAINLDRQALGLCPPGHRARADSLDSLALHLRNRYKQLGRIEDIEESITSGREALELLLPGHPNLLRCLNGLALSLQFRYSQLGTLSDLTESVVLRQQIRALSPPGHPFRAASLENLACCLSYRYKSLGTIEDLHECIVLGRDALMLRPPGHPDRSRSLDNLAGYLSNRYNSLGTIEDLQEAIVLGRDALMLRPLGHPDRSRSLDNLALYLRNRHKQLCAADDITEAIILHRESLALLRPLSNPLRPFSLTSLADSLHCQYEQVGIVQDLDKAIAFVREAIPLRPLGHPEHPTSLVSLAEKLYSRYDHVGSIDDLLEAICLCKDALSIYPSTHVGRSETLHNLARYLRTCFAHSKQPKDNKELFNLFAQFSESQMGCFFADLSVSRTWVDVAEEFQHPTTIIAYETSLRLLTHYLAVLPSLPRHLHLLRDFASSLAVDAFSACLRKCSPTKAVELLEQGRAVFWTQLARLRSPVDDVAASGPDGKTLADKFTQLTSRIRHALQSRDPNQHDRIFGLNIDLQRLVSEIRKLPNCSHFLLPATFIDIQQAAKEGPVIIVNASKYGCDALIVLLNQDPVRIPLAITKDRVGYLSSVVQKLTVRAKFMDVTKDLIHALSQIWDEVVSPIVEVLRTILPLQSRVWWCPTSEFCLLPLHAAGVYVKGRHQERFPYLYISSYTPTLSGLIYARRYQSSSSPCENKRFVAIGQAKAKGQSELQSINTELTSIGHRAEGLAAFTRVEGSNAHISGVVEALEKNDWVHMACHGLPNRKQPFDSAFGLFDGRLTVHQIIQCELKNAQFAYLSACHTTVGYEDGLDEMIHLASAMQFAGFRSVIGTMWAVDDRQTIKITSMFYDNMKDESGQLDYTRAASALRKTMNEATGLSFDQRILYIHLGV